MDDMTISKIKKQIALADTIHDFSDVKRTKDDLLNIYQARKCFDKCIGNNGSFERNITASIESQRPDLCEETFIDYEKNEDGNSIKPNSAIKNILDTHYIMYDSGPHFKKILQSYIDGRTDTDTTIHIPYVHSVAQDYDEASKVIGTSIKRNNNH